MKDSESDQSKKYAVSALMSSLVGDRKGIQIPERWMETEKGCKTRCTVEDY